MSIITRRICVSGLAAFSATAIAFAGPDWIEGDLGTGEAGSLPGGANQPTGAGGLNTISGRLNGPGPAPPSARGIGTSDFEDMYVIFIDDPIAFTARTDNGDFNKLSGADFPSSLWLFDSQGRGVIANQNTPDNGASMPQGALLLPQATDPPAQMIPGPGIYFLAITGDGAQALSGGGIDPIFGFFIPQEISSPDGPGGLNPIDDWSSSPLFGDYTIALTGASFFVTNSCPWNLNGDGFVGAADLALLLGSWGVNPGSPADFNMDGFVGAADLAQLLGAWGPCP